MQRYIIIWKPKRNIWFYCISYPCFLDVNSEKPSDLSDSLSFRPTDCLKCPTICLKPPDYLSKPLWERIFWLTFARRKSIALSFISITI